MKAVLLYGCFCIAAMTVSLAASFAADLPAKTVAGSIPQSPDPLSRPFDRAKAVDIVVDLDAPLGQKTLKVANVADKSILAQAMSGDHIKIDVDNLDNPTVITKVAEITRPVDRTSRLIAFALSFGILLLIASAVAGWQPQKFLIGADNRYSNSKCQLALWFGAVATVYLSAVALRLSLLGPAFIGGVGLPQNLVILTGLSAFTFGGAKAITVKKIADAARPGGTSAKPSAARANLLSDLVQNDKQQLDIGDFQMILVTMAAVTIFILGSFHFLGSLQVAESITLADVDTTLLSGFGLGQGAYLVKKAASAPGDG